MSQREELFERKRRAMELMDGGMSWEEANEKSGLNREPVPDHTIRHLNLPNPTSGLF